MGGSLSEGPLRGSNKGSCRGSLDVLGLRVLRIRVWGLPGSGPT